MHPPPDPVLDAYVAELVAGFPPLTDEERAAVAVLMRPTVEAQRKAQQPPAPSAPDADRLAAISDSLAEVAYAFADLLGVVAGSRAEASRLTELAAAARQLASLCEQQARLVRRDAAPGVPPTS